MALLSVPSESFSHQNYQAPCLAGPLPLPVMELSLSLPCLESHSRLENPRLLSIASEATTTHALSSTSGITSVRVARNLASKDFPKLSPLPILSIPSWLPILGFAAWLAFGISNACQDLIYIFSQPGLSCNTYFEILFYRLSTFLCCLQFKYRSLWKINVGQSGARTIACQNTTPGPQYMGDHGAK